MWTRKPQAKSIFHKLFQIMATLTKHTLSHLKTNSPSSIGTYRGLQSSLSSSEIHSIGQSDVAFKAFTGQTWVNIWSVLKNYAIEKECQLHSLPCTIINFPWSIWKFTSHYGIINTVILDCINENKYITLENYRHQRIVNLTNNAWQTSSQLVSTGHA